MSDPELPTEPAVPAASSDARLPTGDPVFDALWDKVMASWEDDKAHGALLEYALASERLPDVAGRYRALKADPEKGPKAQKRLDAIVLAATQMMMSMKTPANVKVPLAITLSAVGIFLFALVFMAYAFLHKN